MQGPKRPRGCTLQNPGGHPSCGSRCPLNPPNRRIRTRMSGGVGGEEPRGSPLSQFNGRRHFRLLDRRATRNRRQNLPCRIAAAIRRAEASHTASSGRCGIGGSYRIARWHHAGLLGTSKQRHARRARARYKPQSGVHQSSLNWLASKFVSSGRKQAAGFSQSFGEHPNLFRRWGIEDDCGSLLFRKAARHGFVSS